MKISVSSRVVGLAALLVVVGACKSGPPAISDLKVGKDKEVTQVATAFDARETFYAVAAVDNPPKGGKVVGRLSVVDVAGQQAGPIPGLEASVELTAGVNTANFNFSAPTAGWPDGKYKLDVVLLDGTGAEKSQKSAEITTTGNAPAVAAEPAADATATDAPAADETEATATDGTEQ